MPRESGRRLSPPETPAKPDFGSRAPVFGGRIRDGRAANPRREGGESATGGRRIREVEVLSVS